LARYATSQKVPVRVQMRPLDFSIYLILPVELGPGVYSACNRNEYQKIVLLVKRGRRISRQPNRRLSRKCGILDISEPCKVFTACYRDDLSFTYVNIYILVFDYYFYVIELQLGFYPVEVVPQ
jgi:hypothetical protein